MKRNTQIRMLSLFTAAILVPGAASAQNKARTEAAPTAATQSQQPSTPTVAVPPEVLAQLEALKAEVEALKKHDEKRELEELKADAETAITAAPEEDEEKLATKSFKGGERSLQALNPELSIVGDLFGRFVYQNGEIYSAQGGRTGFFPRVAGIHFQANLDPFSLMKVVVGVSPSGVELGEVYITWNALAENLSITVGKFHQQFGVVNRWHAPGLDQFAYPLVLTEHFGGPLVQTGLSFLVTLPPLWADHLEVEVQATNGQNEKLFAGDFFSVPSGLVHVRNYWDLNRDTYLELGLSGLVGVNNAWGKTVESETPVQLYDSDGNPVTFYDSDGNTLSIVSTTTSSVENDGDWRLTAVGGADLTLNWEPVNKSKYRGFTWRSEFLYAYKQVATDTGGDTIKSWGAYSYVQYKPVQNWYFGARGDLTQPFVLDSDGEYTWGVAPYITWWQSPWVRLRLEYNYIDWADCKGMDPEHRVLLQTTFSAGPHKHERY
ncbi:MAG: hypothetical protein MUC50_14420 [Myxococcota bacterium]|jgi:hypothetical protein|nr:hypothetical protein [Myxococcota bacterium]